MNMFLLVMVGALCFAPISYAQAVSKDDAMQNCPMHNKHMESSHEAIVEQHGDEAMGFSHDKTTHHFRLLADGGVIEVSANDAQDRASRDAIRAHLSQLAISFKHGDFSSPMFIHDGIPPGVTTMKHLKGNIAYRYEEISSGGRIRIDSHDQVALAAIHDFLRFQISEHHTGDSPEVEAGPQ